MTEQPQDAPSDALAAMSNLAQRCGATKLVYGQANDDEPGRWWAELTFYNGVRMVSEEHPTVDAALDALAKRVLHGGECQGCGKVSVVHVDGADGYRIPDKITTLDGRKVQRSYDQMVAEGLCRWTRPGSRWQRACGDSQPDHTTRERLAQALAQARVIPAEMIGAARAGRYDEIHSDLAFPLMALATDLSQFGEAGEKLAQRVRDGEFDSSAREYQEWRESEEGQQEAALLLGLLADGGEAGK